MFKSAEKLREGDQKFWQWGGERFHEFLFCLPPPQKNMCCSSDAHPLDAHTMPTQVPRPSAATNNTSNYKIQS